jgi:hypothetical protein
LWKSFKILKVGYIQTCTSLESSTMWHPKEGHHSVLSPWKRKGQQWGPWRAGPVQEAEHGGIVRNSWTCHHKTLWQPKDYTCVCFTWTCWNHCYGSIYIVYCVCTILMCIWKFTLLQVPILRFMQVHVYRLQVQVLCFNSKSKLDYGCFLIGYID